MARMSCGRRAGKLGEECDEKAAVEEGNSDGFILEVGLAIPRFDHGRAARALEQPGVQGLHSQANNYCKLNVLNFLGVLITILNLLLVPYLPTLFPL
jgi:hypothetical protein